MPKQTTEPVTYVAGDRVRQGTREGDVVLGVVPVPLPGLDIDVEHLIRVRWDGNTFSNVVDKRGLVKVD